MVAEEEKKIVEVTEAMEKLEVKPRGNYKRRTFQDPDKETCNKCGEDKPHADFIWKKSKERHIQPCRVCYNVYQKIWRRKIQGYKGTAGGPTCSAEALVELKRDIGTVPIKILAEKHGIKKSQIYQWRAKGWLQTTE